MLLARARIDAEGRMIDADPRVLDLARRAGGELGDAMPVPEIAGLARLSRRLGIVVSRSIVVADGDEDLELWVRAEPEPAGVTIDVGGWLPRAAWRADTPSQQIEADFARTGADWTWETDASLRLTHLPIDAGSRFGFDAAAALGQPLVKLFVLAEDRHGAFPILGAVAGGMRFDGQSAVLRPTGLPVRLSAVPRVDDRGRFAGFIGSAQAIDADQSQQVTTNVGAIPARFGERLDRALRQPLERIVANASSMSAAVDGPLADSYAGYADDIATAGRHLLALVTDLVDLEAVERDDFAIVSEPIDLADVARRAAGLLSVRAAERNVRIDRPASDDTLPATGDFRRSLQVLVNLIANAVRYSPEGGMIWVRTEREGGGMCVIVADQGKGIAVADHMLIFEKFGRVDASEPGGSGLGLYISRRLARAMGGDITVDSAPGQGARFVFTLPAR